MGKRIRERISENRRKYVVNQDMLITAAIESVSFLYHVYKV